MDAEDAIYLLSAVLIGIGAGWWFAPGAGLICLGSMLAIPPIVSLFRGPRDNKKAGDK